MREPAPDFSTGPYERVNQPWLCGLASEGAPCQAGPTARGQCPALAECAPLRDGDRWRCNRSSVRGGPCDEGPTHEGNCPRVHRCRPVPSLRTVRGRFVAACALLATGALLIVLNSGARDLVLAPGPLAEPHAQLLARTRAAADCAACHSAAQRNIAGWTATLVTGHGSGPTQSELCMKCHAATIHPELALRPHNVPTEELQELIAARSVTSTKASHRDASQSLDSRIACAACHREHQGPQADIAAMDNAACQACHRQRYASFAADHPDFGRWPYERRTQIAFNHASHRVKHFAEKKQAFDCRQCHVEDAMGTRQLTLGYEAACAACHDEKIGTSVAQGVPIFELPMLDVEALRAAGHDVGEWPEGASGDFDGRLPPPMKLLLAGDPAAAKAIATLGEDFEFFDVDPDDAEQLAATADLAVAIKNLLFDVRDRGPAAVRERLSATLARDVAPAEVAALMAGLSPESLRGAAAWVAEASAATEAADWAREFNLVGLVELGPPYNRFGPAGGWHRDETTFSLRYRPAVHADPVLTAWLELLAATPELADKPLAMAMFKELTSSTAAGLCASCHSVEQAALGRLTVNWSVFAHASQRRAFTKFAHGPHVTLPQLANCTLCHAVNDEATAATDYASWDEHQFVRDFLPMSKHECARCHTAAAAGDRCQSCHHYHVGVGSL